MISMGGCFLKTQLLPSVSLSRSHAQVAHAKAAVSSMKTDFGGASSGSSSDPTDAFMKSLKMEDYDNEDDGTCVRRSYLYCSPFQYCWSTMELSAFADSNSMYLPFCTIRSSRIESIQAPPCFSAAPVWPRTRATSRIRC